jgi:putative FmdB family regulatory protein
MPLYEYQCEACGLKFHKLLPRATSEAQSCTDCGENASKQVSASNFAFGESRRTGKTGANTETAGGDLVAEFRDGNTGVHSVDSNIDQIIGRDSERRWNQVETREDAKKGVRREHQDRRVAVSRTPDGEYKPMKSVDGVKQMQDTYSTVLREHRAERERKGQGQFSDTKTGFGKEAGDPA